MSAPTQRPPPPRPRPSDPKLAAGAPPPPSNTRKTSQPAVTAVKQSPKFYDGPTVSAKAGEVADKAKTAANKTAQVAKIQSKKAAAKVRRHPWGFASLLTTIPFLIAISLFSTVLCPPPRVPQSSFSRLVTTRLGLHGASPKSGLHETLCYPANVYHREVLQPYVYPVLDNLHLRAQNHPAYVNILEPAYVQAAHVGSQAWNGPIKPVLLRLRRGYRRFWFKFVEPHVPYLRAKYYAITAPYTARLSALHKSHLQPHINTATKHANRASKQASDTYSYIAAHPMTGRAGRYASKTLMLAQRRTEQTYRFIRPHVIRAGNEAERVARETLGPQALRAINAAGAQVSKVWKIIKANVAQQYRTHLEPHVGPYVAQANKAVAPQIKVLRTKVYTPYVLPVLKTVLPASVFAPSPERTFWSIMADFLPLAGSNAAAQRGSMSGYANSAAKQAASKAKEKTAFVKAKSSSYSKTASSATASVKSKASTAAAADRATASVKANSLTKKDVEDKLKSLKIKVDSQGDRSYKNLRAELITLNNEFAKETLAKMSEAGTGELQRESEYVLKGMDKLFSSSTSLTKDQVASAGGMAENRLQSRANKVRERVDKQHNEAMPEKRNALYQKEADKMDALAKVQSRELDELKAGIAANPAVFSKKDMDAVANMAKACEEWKGKFVLLRDGRAADRSIKSSFAEIDKAIKYANNDLNEVVEAFKDRVRSLSKTANERIDAMANVRASASSSATKSTKSGGFSILPIVEAAAADGGIGAVIGKGKEQVMDALSQASAAGATVVGGSSGTAAVQASQATQSVKSAAAQAVPSTESVQGQAQAAFAAVIDSIASGASAASASASSAADVAAASASSLVSAAMDNLHSATRSIISAAGATPSPEGMMEHLESIANVVAQGAASVYGVAEENVHAATRSAMSAVGATPAPEGVVEHAQSFASEVSKTAASLLAQASQSAGSAASAASASASSVYIAAGSAVVDAASAVSSGAVNAPSDVVSAAQAVASSASASAEALASAASSAVHTATRSAMYAAGATPSPEGVMEHLESASLAASQSVKSAAAAVSASAASVADAASSLVHDGTRSAVKAVGATPAPETPLETLEAAALAASASAASVYDAGASAAASAGLIIADQAVLLGSSIQSLLAAATAASTPTAEPLLSSASAYLAGLTAQATPTASGVLASGSSILSSLQSRASVLASEAGASASSLADEAASSVHSATRAASRAVGATPTPETASEVLEDAVGKVKKALGRDEL